MTESLLERSARFLDRAAHDGPESLNPMDGSFHEIAQGVGLVCGFDPEADAEHHRNAGARD